MADLGKLWFSIGLNDETDKDYDKIKKKIVVLFSVILAKL